MKEYVLVFAHALPGHIPQRIILIEKLKPEWQFGRYNLPGGKIEEGESPAEAASRELQEETNLHCPPENMKLLGTMYGPPWQAWKVYVFFAPYHNWHNSQAQKIRSLTDEVVVELDYRVALTDPRLIPNLRLIIPLCIGQVDGWQIVDGPGPEIKYSAML